MSISPATLRQRVATELEGLSGWHELQVPMQAFRPESMPEEYHLGFVAELGTTTPIAGRQTPSEGATVATVVRVRFAYLLRTEGAVVARDGAATAEVAAAAAVRGMAVTGAQPPRLSAPIRRSTAPANKPTHVVTDLEWTILHQYPLQ